MVYKKGEIALVLEKKQVICMLINIICIKMIMTYPRILVQYMGNATWINIIYVSLIVLFLYYIIGRFYKPEYGTFVSAAEKIGGKTLKRITGVIIAAVFVINIAFEVRSYPETVKTVLLEETKMQIIIILYILTSAVGAYLGIESNARIHSIFIPIAGVIMLGFFLLSMPYWKINNIMPILGNGAENIFIKGTQNICMMSDITVLNYLMPHISIKRDIKNSGYIAIIISAVVSLFIIGTYNLIYPYPVSSDFILTVYQISRIVKVGMFFQRWEAFFQFVWSIGMYLYTSLYISVIAGVIAEAFDLKFSKILVFPIAIIVTSVAFMINMQNSLTMLAAGIYSMIVIAFCVPIIYGSIIKMKSCERE